MAVSSNLTYNRYSTRRQEKSAGKKLILTHSTTSSIRRANNQISNQPDTQLVKQWISLFSYTPDSQHTIQFTATERRVWLKHPAGGNGRLTTQTLELGSVA